MRRLRSGVALGIASTMALLVTTPASALSEGQVAGWGYVDAVGADTLYPPGELPELVTVAAGMVHNLGVTSDGSVVSWGNRTPSTDYGQFDVPSGLSGVTKVAAGAMHSLALKSDGTVVAWGANVPDIDAGQADVPSGLTGVVDIETSFYSPMSAAITADGNLVGWGDDYGSGALTAPEGAGDLTQVSLGYVHSVALQSDGTALVWGNPTYTAGAPEDMTNITDVAAGAFFSAVLRADGTVDTWGQAGIVPDTSSWTDVVAIDAGYYHVVAAFADGSVASAGIVPQINEGSEGVTNADFVAAGLYHSLALNQPPLVAAPTVGSVKVSGLARPGRMVSAVTTDVTGSPTLDYQWQSGGGGTWSDIAGATQNTYTLGGEQAGRRVRVVVTATNASGSATETSHPRRVDVPVNVRSAGQPKPAGGACTTKGSSGDDAIAVSVPARKTRVICVGRGADSVTINQVGNGAQLVIVKTGTESLEIVWNAGSSSFGGGIGRDEFTVVRPNGATVTGTHGANQNTSVDGSTALCMTNADYARATTLADLESMITGSLSWAADGDVDDTC